MQLYFFPFTLNDIRFKALSPSAKFVNIFKSRFSVAQKNISGSPVSSVASSTNCQLFNSVRHKVKVFKRRTRRRNRTKSTVELCVPNTFNHNLRTPTSIQSQFSPRSSHMGRPHIGSSVIIKAKLFFSPFLRRKLKIFGRFYIVIWMFFSSNLSSIICNFTFHQNLCI